MSDLAPPPELTGSFLELPELYLDPLAVRAIRTRSRPDDDVHVVDVFIDGQWVPVTDRVGVDYAAEITDRIIAARALLDSRLLGAINTGQEGHTWDGTEWSPIRKGS